jgi:hypothetical protein
VIIFSLFDGQDNEIFIVSSKISSGSSSTNSNVPALIHFEKSSIVKKYSEGPGRKINL